jgi:hypothetical protein
MAVSNKALDNSRRYALLAAVGLLSDCSNWRKAFECKLTGAQTPPDAAGFSSLPRNLLLAFETAYCEKGE